MAPIGFSAADDLTISNTRGVHFTPALLRILLFTVAVASAVLSFQLTRGEASSRAAVDAGADLTRVLHFMALLKGSFGIGVLAMVSVRFRFPVAPHLALAYIASGAIMAAGPAMMWTMSHVGAGALLFYAGIATLFVLAWIDEGAIKRFARGPTRPGRPI